MRGSRSRRFAIELAKAIHFERIALSRRFPTWRSLPTKRIHVAELFASNHLFRAAAIVKAVPKAKHSKRAARGSECGRRPAGSGVKKRHESLRVEDEDTGSSPKQSSRLSDRIASGLKSQASSLKSQVSSLYSG